MKKFLKSLLVFMLVTAMFFSVVGCGEQPTVSTDEGPQLDDDFFADTETLNSKEDTVTSSGDKQTTNSSTTSSSSKPNANKNNAVNGKSWEDVLAEMPKSLRGKTVVMYNWNPPSEYTGAPTVISKFEKETGIKVKWNTVNWDVYQTRLAALVASNDAPDMVRTRTPRPDWIASFQPLTTTKFDFSDAAWDQQSLKDYSVNGVPYAVTLEGTHVGSCAMIHYNKALIKKYDLEDPYILWKNGKWTLSKFIEMARYYKKESGAEYGVVMMGVDGWISQYGLMGPVSYNGSSYNNALSDAKLLKTTQEFYSYMNTEKLFGAGRHEVFDSDEVLFAGGEAIYARKKNSYFGNVKQNGAFYCVPMPTVDGQSTYYQNLGEYEAYGIAKGAKNPEAVPYFLRYFLDPANYDMDGFFCNAQNYEVYQWCMSQKNTIWSTRFWSTEDKFSDGLATLEPNQIKSYFDSNSGMINQRVKNYNKILEDLKKAAK